MVTKDKNAGHESNKQQHIKKPDRSDISVDVNASLSVETITIQTGYQLPCLQFLSQLIQHLMDADGTNNHNRQS